ncbi:MAG: hypothetical protein IH988_02020 [Planctomycetes bacterium]|nr:hypothetical protein [Planctomycetota bacterium]
MPYLKSDVAEVLRSVDLGSSVAESDPLLESARVETSVFTDLVHDRVDLIPGTKGSGKSALYRIVVEFLPDYFYQTRKVVVAHGVRADGDNVFHVFKEEFDRLSEDDFVNFWCVYLVSLAHEHFLKNEKYAADLARAQPQIEAFVKSCAVAKIPEIQAKKTLRDVLEWALGAIPRPRPKVVVRPNTQEIEFDLFGEPAGPRPNLHESAEPTAMPRYINQVKDDLESILDYADLSLWLMVDRLDEVFPRRSETETRALRGLLRTLKVFSSNRIRVKVFLRDDILEQVTAGREGFTALTHVTARQADSLRWSEDQILTLIVNRLRASDVLCRFVGLDVDQLKASRDYRRDAFYKIFPPTVHPGSNQSATLRWIYTHTMDGRGVVTPRDVIDLLTRAKQHQQDECDADANGSTHYIIGPSSIQYGLRELSERKRTTLLKAEFPHFWEDIRKLEGGKTEYSERALQNTFGKKWHSVIEDLVGIGLFEEAKRSGRPTFKVPFLYREGLSLTQGSAE